MDLNRHYLALLESEHACTMRVIRAADDTALLWRPHEKNRTFAVLAAHIYHAGHFFIRVIKDDQPLGRPEPQPPADLEALCAVCQSLHDAFLESWNQLDAAETSREYSMDYMGSLSAAELLGMHLRHMIHHRAQLQMYLRLLGLVCPGVYGASADESWEDVRKRELQDE